MCARTHAGIIQKTVVYHTLDTGPVTLDLVLRDPGNTENAWFLRGTDPAKIDFLHVSWLPGLPVVPNSGLPGSRGLSLFGFSVPALDLNPKTFSVIIIVFLSPSVCVTPKLRSLHFGALRQSCCLLQGDICLRHLTAWVSRSNLVWVARRWGSVGIQRLPVGFATLGPCTLLG